MEFKIQFRRSDSCKRNGSEEITNIDPCILNKREILLNANLTLEECKRIILEELMLANAEISRQFAAKLIVDNRSHVDFFAKIDTNFYKQKVEIKYSKNTDDSPVVSSIHENLEKDISMHKNCKMIILDRNVKNRNNNSAEIEQMNTF